jgi:hypothetical protein
MHARKERLPAYFDHLRKTGRAWAVDAIRERHGIDDI